MLVHKRRTIRSLALAAAVLALALPTAATATPPTTGDAEVRTAEDHAVMAPDDFEVWAGSGEVGVAGLPNGCVYEVGWYSTSRGWGCFRPYGEHLFVADTLWDGFGIQVVYSYWDEDGDRREGICRDYNGTSDGEVHCNLSLPENMEIDFELQMTDDGEVWTIDSTTGWT